MRLLTAAVIAVLLVPVSALAKEGIELSSTPDGLIAGQPWDTDISAVPRRRDLPATHGIAIHIFKPGSGEQRTFAAARNGSGGYHARVIFPSPGTWTYEVVGLGRYHQQNWAPVDIGAGTHKASFPWPWMVGGAVAMALAVARFRPWRNSPSAPSVDPPPSSS
jgi:hypothetical protein